MNRSTPGLPVQHQLPEFKLTTIESVMPSSHLILCHPLLLLPPISPSIRVFSSESTLRLRWPKYWSFSFSISPSSEYSGLISIRIDWLDLLAVQWTQESPPTLQFKSINSLALSFLYGPSRYITCICTVFLNLGICFIKLDMLKSWTDALMSSVYEYVYVYVSNSHIRVTWHRRKEWFDVILLLNGNHRMVNVNIKN